MKAFFLAILLALHSSLIHATNLDEITWLTEEYPPYNYKEDGIVQGIAVDFLLEIWKKLEINKKRSDIKLIPWARGVMMLQTQPNTCLFSTTLTDERLNVLGWKFAYPIPKGKTESDNHLIAKADKGLSFNSINDVLNYKGNFGVVRGDVGASLLLNLGVGDNKLEKTTSPQTLSRMLQADRFDVVSYSINAMKNTMKKEGIDPSQYESVYTFPVAPLGYAFHHNIDPNIIKAVQNAIDELYAEGKADKIIRRYQHKLGILIQPDNN
jgi:polar amino acid transport system substrate-binding protein